MIMVHGSGEGDCYLCWARNQEGGNNEDDAIGWGFQTSIPACVFLTDRPTEAYRVRDGNNLTAVEIDIKNRL